MPNWKKVFEFIARIKHDGDDVAFLREMRRMVPEDQKAGYLALDLSELMSTYNFTLTPEEAQNIYEFKDNFNINDWHNAWRIYNEGGEIERVQNVPADSCFENYLEQLRAKDWNEENLENMRRQTVNLINQMYRFSTEHPEQLCTALVVGHVQSGKTANYCADINFWIDLHRSDQIPGYDTFIILTSNNTALGTQTEKRLRKDIIPVRNWCNGQQEVILREYGGLLPFRKDDPLRSEKRNAIDGNILSYTPCNENSKCLVAVVIKNRQTVERLDEIISHLPNSPRGIIIIDDEADVITPTLTKRGDAAATRKHILEIVRQRTEYPTAYVAFTATPYATVLNQHPSTDKNPLYPHIAQVLTPSKEYFGSERILGACNEDPSGQVIPITDFKDKFPESMKDAFAWFICSAAARRIKNRNGRSHQATTMLIHLSKKVVEHKVVQKQLYKYLCDNSNDLIARCQKHWCDENGVRQRYSRNDLPMDYPGRENAEVFDITWDTLLEEILLLINENPTTGVNDFSRGINFRIVNATARTAQFDFHYPAEQEVDFDTAFVTIGGDRIARGLTLEGLTTTYFGRETQFGDTLLQYARWHGYRKGYEVLPRIWMTLASITAFKDAAAMEKVSREKWNMEFEQQLDHWIHPLTVACPINSGIKPSGKMAEAIGSMKQANRFQFETNTFPADTNIWRNVREKTEDFLRKLGSWNPPEILRGNTLWKDVSSAVIIEFLQEIAQRYPDSATFCSWLKDDQFRMLQNNTRWNVCFIPLTERTADKPVFQLPGSYFNGQSLRTVKLKNKTEHYFYVKTIRSVISDDVADIDYEGNAPKTNERVDAILKRAENYETPLLRIYLHAPMSDNGELWLDDMSGEEGGCNPVVLLSIRRKLPENIMLSLQVNPADLGVDADYENRKQHIADTTFELFDENDNSREVYCRFTPSNNPQRNTPTQTTLLRDSKISDAQWHRITDNPRVSIIGTWHVDEYGGLTEDICLDGLLAYELAGYLLDNDHATKEFCEYWIDQDDDEISLLNLLKGE